MANLIKDFHNDSPITPYLGGGAGIAWQTIHLNAKHNDSLEPVKVDATRTPGIKVSDGHYKTNYGPPYTVNELAGYLPATGGEYVKSKETTLGLAYQAMAGIGMELSGGFFANVGYRYFATAEDVETHSFEAGLRYEF